MNPRLITFYLFFSVSIFTSNPFRRCKNTFFNEKDAELCSLGQAKLNLSGSSKKNFLGNLKTRFFNHAEEMAKQATAGKKRRTTFSTSKQFFLFQFFDLKRKRRQMSSDEKIERWRLRFCSDDERERE